MNGDGEVDHSDFLAFGQDGGALHGIGQFPDVSRPRIVCEYANHVIREMDFFEAGMLTGRLCDEVLEQVGEVVYPVA